MRHLRLFKALCFSSAFISIIGCNNHKVLRIKTEIIKVDSTQQIVSLTNSLVKPLLYTKLTRLDKLPVNEAKDKFISAILPSILVAKHTILQEKNTIEILRDKKNWDASDSTFYLTIKNRYKATDLNDLLNRMTLLPNSIVLAQAAMESGWGKSRIFLTANNLFGVWSYNANEPRIQALLKREKKRIYLRSYSDLSQSVIHYFEILGRSRSYKNLRLAQAQTDDPFELLPHLKNYSERRLLYTNQLKKVILKNKLTQYDQYQLDPQYLVEE